MEHRGPILLLFSGLLIMAPLAIRSVEIALAGGVETREVQMIQTTGAQRAQCAGETFRANTYAIGCEAGVQRDSGRHELAGGAVSIRN